MPAASDECHSLCSVTVSDKGVRQFPALPSFPTEPTPQKTNVPGVYRLIFNNNGYIYIGKTNDLRRRFGNYRKPTSGTEQEHVLRYILVDREAIGVHRQGRVFFEDSDHAARIWPDRK